MAVLTVAPGWAAVELGVVVLLPQPLASNARLSIRGIMSLRRVIGFLGWCGTVVTVRGRERLAGLLRRSDTVAQAALRAQFCGGGLRPRR